MVIQSDFHTVKPQLLGALCILSGFRREADENRALLGYYAASSDNFLLTFRSNISVPSLRVKKSEKSLPLKMGPIGFTETSVRNSHYSLCNDPEERSSHEASSKKVQWSVFSGAPGLCTARRSVH